MTATNGTTAPVSPVEYVRGLSPEDKDRVLVALLKEAIEIQGGRGLIPIYDGDEDLGYYVPPAAADERFRLYGPKFTPEQWAEIDARMERAEQEEGIPLDDKFKADFLAELERRVAERCGRPSP